MRDEFVNFLKENNVYEKFLKKFEQGTSIDVHGPFDSYLDLVSYEEFVIEAFYWGMKSDFWGDIHDKWLEYLDSI